MNYGECLRKIRNYCIDKKIKNETLVNEPLEDFFSAAKLKKQKGKNKGAPFHYEYSESSRIINNDLEISPQIRDALRRIGMEEIIEESVQCFYEDNIDKSCQSYDSHHKSCHRGYSVDFRSYINYECEKAAKEIPKIVVIYNYANVYKSKCPEAVRYLGEHINGYYKRNDGNYYWNYQEIKNAIMD